MLTHMVSQAVHHWSGELAKLLITPYCVIIEGNPIAWERLTQLPTYKSPLARQSLDFITLLLLWLVEFLPAYLSPGGGHLSGFCLSLSGERGWRNPLQSPVIPLLCGSPRECPQRTNSGPQPSRSMHVYREVRAWAVRISPTNTPST